VAKRAALTDRANMMYGIRGLGVFWENGMKGTQRRMRWVEVKGERGGDCRSADSGTGCGFLLEKCCWAALVPD
jgi:hypothetical protein